jgi:hypothetical protein
MCSLTNSLWEEYAQLLRDEGQSKADLRYQMTAIHVRGCPDHRNRRDQILAGSSRHRVSSAKPLKGARS